MQSCELFGLEYQTDYNNTYTPIETELNMTAYQFIESRKGIDMAFTFEAIEKAELKSLYEKDSLTYFLVKDAVFASILAEKKISSIAAAQKVELQSILKGYIIKGMFLSSTMTSTPTQVLTENGVNEIVIRLLPSLKISQNQYQINVAYVPASGTILYKNVSTSNLKPKNGVIHILGEKL